MKTFALLTFIAVLCEASVAWPWYGNMKDCSERISFIEDKLNTLQEMHRDFCLSGLKSGKIPESAITASSTHPHCPIDKARLDANISWCALQNNIGEWLQVDLGQMQPVTGIITQARHAVAQWVTKYKVEVGPDVYNLKPVLKDGNIAIFEADKASWVWNKFPERVHARIVRIYPLTYHGHMSMRFDVTFC